MVTPRWRWAAGSRSRAHPVGPVEDAGLLGSWGSAAWQDTMGTEGWESCLGGRACFFHFNN